MILWKAWELAQVGESDEVFEASKRVAAIGSRL